jgi:hypothetical protein
MKIFLIVTLLLVFSIPALAQGTVNFAWDVHPEAAQLTGFKLYQSKVSGSYGLTPVATFSGGALVSGSIPKPGLGRYYYVLTAFNAEVESDVSNEVTLTIKPKAPKLNTATQVGRFQFGPVDGAEKMAGLTRNTVISRADRLK